MGLDIGRADHDVRLSGLLGGQTYKNPGEQALLAPSLPEVVEGLIRTILAGRITPSQAIAVEEGYSAPYSSVIDTELSVVLREEGLEARHLRLDQLDKVALGTVRFSEP